MAAKSGERLALAPLNKQAFALAESAKGGPLVRKDALKSREANSYIARSFLSTTLHGFSASLLIETVHVHGCASRFARSFLRSLPVFFQEKENTCTSLASDVSQRKVRLPLLIVV